MNLLQEWSGHWSGFTIVVSIFVLSLCIIHKCSESQKKIEEEEFEMIRREENGTVDTEEYE